MIDELQLGIGNLILLLQFVILDLQSTDSYLEQLVFPLCVHSIVVIELVLLLLEVVLLLPLLDLLPQLVLHLLLLLGLSSQLADSHLELLDLLVLYLRIGVILEFHHFVEQLLFLALHIDVVGCHVFIFVLP